jgi:tetratricopeptide (TPR) repeat protein
MPKVEINAYDHVNPDESARQRQPNERNYLEVEFLPGDDARPSHRKEQECFMIFRAQSGLGAFAAAAMLALAVLSPLAPVQAQTLTDTHCNGKPEIPDDQQILGCSDAIRSGILAGKDLAEAFSNRGRAYYGKGDLDRAMADYDRALDIDASSAVLFYRRCVLHLFWSDYGHAIDACTKSLALDPDFAVAFNGRGNAYAAKGDTDRAIADLDQALKLDPANAVAMNNRGRAYQAKGDIDRAIAEPTTARRFGSIPTTPKPCFGAASSNG